MPPTKRKPPLRRQVLDLKGEDSTLRSTWQTKYQQIQSDDGVHQNGGSHLETVENTCATVNVVKMNPLSELVGNYNSDSDGEDTTGTQKSNVDAKVEDFLREIQSISSESVTTNEGLHSHSQPQLYAPPLTKWQQCYDHNSGYPYYWNIETNEVTWEIPPEYKAALASAALKQQQQQQPIEYYPQQQETHEPSLPKEKKLPKTKVICNYPWQNGSDSEDEKIEMITSFGPQSGEDESEEGRGDSNRIQESKKNSKGVPIGPQLPASLLHQGDNKRPSESDDTEAESLNDSSYETSCLLTHRVQDTGPPGDDGFNPDGENNIDNETVSKVNLASNTCSEEADHCIKKDSDSFRKKKPPASEKSDLNSDYNEKVVEVPAVGKMVDESSLLKVIRLKSKENITQDPCFDFADNVIAEIEKEMPPDYKNSAITKTEEKAKEEPPLPISSSSSTSASATFSSSIPPSTPVSLDTSNKVVNNAKTSGISGIALLANYEDDSESEEGFVSEKRKSQEVKTAETTEKTVKPLFPCIELDVKEPPPPQERKAENEMSKFYESDLSLPDSVTMHKAFKRKKRIEFATRSYSPSTSAETKPSSPDSSRVWTNSQYNMDPTSNDHTGFGFSLATCLESSKPKTHGGWIHFVKSETINLNQDIEQRQRGETRTEGKQTDTAQNEIPTEDIEDSASLLKEKVTFLSEGKDEVSPIQHIAIQLETLFGAWQQGALSNMYFFRWVKDKCSDLIRYEKSAAPTGWTCLWDRKSKRYYYQNVATKAVQWDYPTSESTLAPVQTKSGKEADAEGGGEEMDLCFTPPHPSTAEEDKLNSKEGSVLPEAKEVNQKTCVPSKAAVSDSEKPRGAKSLKRKELSTTCEDDAEVKSKAGDSGCEKGNEKEEETPPLPPMPPPPPPPPEDPPPPPPSSPPPLPLDPDQPLPPGVDEPEYGLFRRLSPKKSVKKCQMEASSFGSDVLMTYGFAVQVPPNTSSVATISMQPVDYHGYVHETLGSNHYVQSPAPTSHIIHCPAKKSKLSLSSELNSFYSDIAMLDNEPTVEKSVTSERPSSQETNFTSPVSCPQPVVTRPNPPAPTPTLTTTVKPVESSSSNGVIAKKKKRTKLTPGLSTKKKGVSSLVAKWQQVQQEVRRDLSSDEYEDDEDASGTHK